VALGLANVFGQRPSITAAAGSGAVLVVHTPTAARPGLANVFGQRAYTTAAAGSGAVLVVHTPTAARPGLAYEAQLTVSTRRGIAKPALVLDPGWFDGLTINTVDPEPLAWAHRDGRTVLTFAPIPAEEALAVRFQYQVNPTTFGRRTQGVSLEDGGTTLARVVRTLTLYP
jgi:hypothetical protein